jgi:hypothetical protein
VEERRHHRCLRSSYDSRMADVFIVGVPTSDKADLEALAVTIGIPPDFSEQRYFDGQAFIEAVLSTGLSVAGWATLRTWIRARAEVLKATRIAGRGIEITAMDAKDAERMIRVFAEKLPDDDGEV